MASALLAADAHATQVLAIVKRVLKTDTTGLADLLGIPPALLSDWEATASPLDPLARRLLALLMRDAVAGSSATEHALEALSTDQALPAEDVWDFCHLADPRVLSARWTAARVSEYL